MKQQIMTLPNTRTTMAPEAAQQDIPRQIAEIASVLNSIFTNIKGQSDVNEVMARRLLEQSQEIKQLEKRLQVLSASGGLGRPTPVYLGGDIVLARVLGRFKMFLDGKDPAASCSLILDGYWQEAITETLESLLNPGMTMVDLGSGPGYFCLVAAGRIQPNGLVYAFEPDERNYSLLMQNIAINGFAAEMTDTIHAHPLDPNDCKFAQQIPGRVDLVRIAPEYVTPRVFESLLQFRTGNPQLALLADWQPKRLLASGISPNGFRQQIESMGFLVTSLQAPGEAIQNIPENAADPERSTALLLRAR